MTTTALAHLPPDQKKRLHIVTFDRVYDHDKQVMTDEWRQVDERIVDAGQLFQGHCTDCRKVMIGEIPLADD